MAALPVWSSLIPSLGHPGKRRCVSAAIGVIACLAWSAGTVVQAASIDALTFGDVASEAAHSLTADLSEVVSGGLNQKARRLLPKVPSDVYGGEMVFTMQVDPVAQNYLSVKFWGSDANGGCHNPWLVLNINGYELGERHGGSAGAPDIFMNSGVTWYPDRFVYRTVALPVHLTRGKTSVSLKLRSLGWISYYDSGAYYGAYNKLMSTPSLGVYRAYTHTGSFLETPDEAQGTAPTLTTPRTSENITSTLATIKTNVNNALATKLAATAANLSPADIAFLAQCYDAKEVKGQSWIVYPTGKTVTDLINQVLAAIDAEVVAESADAAYVANQGNASWGGYFGPLGEAIRLTWSQLKGSMGTSIAYGGTYGTVTRTVGWTKALRASIDFGRYNRREVGNQAVLWAMNLYLANRGLLLVDSASAIKESEALRYLKEAAGLMPWLSNDQATGGTDGVGGGPVPTYGTAPYGPNWYMVTTKGTTKDIQGFVGSDYGEMGPLIYRMGQIAGDSAIKNQGALMTRARCKFRFPANDDAGNLVMQAPELIGVRNNAMPGHYVYVGHAWSEDLFMVADGASAVGSDLVGYLQQQINEGQLCRMIQGSTDPYLPMTYATIAAMGATGVKLPMSVGASDFAWVDEENMVVAAKHGEERFFANLFWRDPSFISGAAKIFQMTSGYARVADVQIDDLRFRSAGPDVMIGSLVEGFSKYTPPDNPINAMYGLGTLKAWRSDLTTLPASNRDEGRGTGYTLRYGNWLVGINAHYSASYTMQMPSGFSSATDLVSGAVKSGSVVLSAKSAAVFYLPSATVTNPLPAPTLCTQATPGSGRVFLNWNHAGGASTYTIKRATTSGGTSTTIATGLTVNQYVDATVSNGTTYYYQIVSVNANGTNANSPEASATPVASQSSGVGAPWSDRDFGSPATAGSASVANGVYTLSGSGGDLWGTADAGHFLYQPMVGDGTIIARVLSQSSTNVSAKAGVMIRSSLDAGAPRAIMVIEPAKVEFNWRGGTGGTCAAATYAPTPAIAPPYWVRLTRAGDYCYGSISPDGVTWTAIGSRWLGFSQITYVGLVVSPAGAGTDTATFDNVTMPGGASATPATPAGLSAKAGNGSAVLSWTSVPGAYGYRVKRGSSTAGPFVVVGESTGASFIDYGITNGTSYAYTVSSLASPYESANATAVSVTPAAPPMTPANLTIRGSSGSLTLTWTAVPGATSYRIARSLTRTAQDWFTPVAEVTTTSYTDSGLTDGTLYYYSVTALIGKSASVPVVGSGKPPGIPTPWSTRDIGEVGAWGGASYGSSAFTVTGSGADIWNTSDEFRYVYQAAGSSCSITARVASCDTACTGAKMGVMIRDSLAPDSRYAQVFLCPSGKVGFEQRGTTGGSSTTVASTTGLSVPYWLRLTRSATTVTAYRSTDGSTWTTVGSLTIALNAQTVIGLSVCSVSDGTLHNAVFDNVSVSGTAIQAPAGVNAGGGASAVTLNWSAVSGATGYTVLRSTTSGSGYAAVKTGLTTTTWSDSTVAAGTTYYYVVTATDGSTTSVYSPEVSAMALAKPAVPTGVTATPGDGQAIIAWTEVTGATSYRVKRATSSGGPYALVTNGATGTMDIDTGLTNGATYYYVVSALNRAGESLDSAEVKVAPLASGALPAPFMDGDIGTVGLAGSAAFSAGTYTVAGAGADIWGTADAFHFAYRPMYGDGTIVARIASQTNPNAWAKASVMMRESLTVGSRHMIVGVSPGNGAFCQYRTATDGATGNSGVTGLAAPYWVKLVRVGNVFTGYRSADGATWTAMTSQTIAMNSTIYVGLAVTAHTTSALCTATFDNVSVVALPSGWSSSDIGAVAAGGSAVQDATGAILVSGSGADIWGTSDELRFAWQPVTGNVDVIARLEGQTATHVWAKAGVMIRNDSSAGSAEIIMFHSPSNGNAMQYRTVASGSCASISGSSNAVMNPPLWIRLVRSGTTFTGYESADGTTWTKVGQCSISMNSTVLVGLAVCSVNDGVLSTALFDEVTVTPTASN